METILSELRQIVKDVMSVLTLDEEEIPRILDDPKSYRRSWLIVLFSIFIQSIIVTAPSILVETPSTVLSSFLLAYVSLLILYFIVIGFFVVVFMLLASFFAGDVEFRTGFTAVGFVTLITAFETVLRALIQVLLPSIAPIANLLLSLISYVWTILALGYQFTEACQFDTKALGIGLVIATGIVVGIVFFMVVFVLASLQIVGSCLAGC